MKSKFKKLRIRAAFATVICIAIVMASCTKENQSEQSPTNHQDQIRLVTLSDGFKSGITMLEFSSIQHYEATIASLENQLEQHEDAFLADWESLADEALNDKEIEVGFVDHQPLIDFENYYNIPVTLRQVYVTAEALWLNNEVLDLATFPRSKFPFGVAEMTLLNGGGEVKIGDKIIKVTERGFVEISNLDIATLIRIDNGDETAYNETTVMTNIDLDGGDKGSCTNWKGKDFPYTYNNDSRKVIKHVHFHSYPWKGVGSAEITSYKKEGNKWKKYRMDLGVAVQTYFRDVNCNPGAAQCWSDWKFKKRRSIEENCPDWSAYPQYRAENGKSIYGHFKYAGYTDVNVLTW
jgi:hypothetical protein